MGKIKSGDDHGNKKWLCMLAVAASGGLLNAAISEATAKAFEPTVDSQTQQSAAMQFTAETAVIADHMLLQGVVESSNSATVPAGATILTITSVEQYQILTQAQLRSANAAVERAEEQLSYTEVKAPYGGVVSDRWVEPGELVQPGTPLLSGFDPAQLRMQNDSWRAVRLGAIFNGLAVSLIFGIAVSTALTLVVIPLLYASQLRRQ